MAKELASSFAGGDKQATVLLYHRAGGLTAADQQKIVEDARDAAKRSR